MEIIKEPLFGNPRPLVIALSMAYVAFMLPLPVTALAQAAPATASFAIQAGPLAGTLQAIARQSGRKIVFDPLEVQALQAPAVQGSYTPEAAVQAALQGSGLQISLQPNGDWLILRASATSKPTAVTEASLPAITVVASRDQAETSFKVDRTKTSTRSDTDLMDLPSAVTVVTSKLLESKQAASLEDAISGISGVGYTKSPMSTPAFQIRGMDANVLTNGLGSTSDSFSGPAADSAATMNVYGMERIEVLKGPQAILSGANTLGGAVNIVTKKPQADRIRELTLQYGSYGDKVVAGDLSGALTEDKRLTYRLIASVERQNKTAFGYDGNKNDYFMPQLRWKDDSTDLIVGYSKDKRHMPASGYTFAGSGYVQDPPSGTLGNQTDGFNGDTQNYFYTLDQKLNKYVSFTSKAQYSTSDQDFRMWAPFGPAGPTDYVYGSVQNVSSVQTLAGDHYLNMNFDSGPLGHKLTVGINHSQTKFKNGEYENTQWSMQPVTVYPNAPDLAPITGVLVTTSTSKSTQLAAYATDQVRWGDFQVLGGFRYSKYWNESITEYLSRGSSNSTPKWDVSKLTPMAGIVYNLTPNTTAYASYTRGFSPQNLELCDNATSGPRESKNKELGLKFDLLDSRFSITAAAFQLDLLNTSEYVATNNCSILVPSQVTKGYELDMAGQIAPGLTLFANATYSTSEDNSGVVYEYAAKPTLRGSAWATYDFQSAALEGWGTGFGVTANNASLLRTRTTFQPDAIYLAGSARLDGNVSYRRKGSRLTLGIRNLADRNLYDFATAPSYVPRQSPRTITLTYKIDL